MKLNSKPDLQSLRQEIEAALAPIAEKHGLDFALGNCRYEADGDHCRFTSLTVQRQGGLTPEAKLFQQHALYEDGIDPDDLGKSFEQNGARYVIFGWKSRARTKPIMLRRDGDDDADRYYKASVAQIAGIKRRGELA